MHNLAFYLFPLCKEIYNDLVMRNLYIVSVILLFLACPVLSAQEEKPNRIWFAEGFTGFSVGEDSGIMYGASFNYQIKKNLLTARYTRNEDLEFVIFFIPSTVVKTDELSLLYGWRTIKNKHSLSFSLGPSFSSSRKNEPFEMEEIRTDSYGVAFEGNIKWFPGKAKRAFQPGGGFKLSGNVADTYYLGLSLVLGLGNHKIY